MKKSFSFGKIAYNGTRRINEVEVEVEFTMNSKCLPTFSAYVNIWNGSHTDCLAFGQLFDEVRGEIKKSELFDEIYDLWSKHHCNDLHRGTPEQMAFLKEHKEELGEGFNYKGELALLTRYGKDIAPDGNRFGHVWFYWPIPDADLKRIESLFEC